MGAFDHAFFYNSVNNDRRYDAESFEYWLKKFFTTGVFNGELQVTSNGNMTVALSPGYVNIGGKVRFFQNTQLFTLETADATYDRIDTIVIERNDSDRDIAAKVVTGGLSINPAITAPTRDPGVHQLIVAQIYVAHGVAKIHQENITDTRMDPALCGLVTGTVEKMDFSGFMIQFEDWFRRVKGILGEDEAGVLLQMIEGLTAKDVGARPDTWMPTVEQVGARPDTWMPTAEQVGARSDTWMPTAEQVGALPAGGGKMTGYITTNGIILTKGVDYGTTFPTDASSGRLFFKKV